MKILTAFSGDTTLYKGDNQMNIKPEISKVPISDVCQENAKLINTLYEINRETAKFYHNYLMSPDGKWAIDYLVDRGLTVQTINHFGLGASPDGWDLLIKHLKSKGFLIKDMLAANVIAKSQKGFYYDRFRHRIMFPVIDTNKNVVAFSGRKMPNDDSESGKYVNTSETPVYKKRENLFGMNFAKSVCEERIILVEGNMDVISLHQAGFRNTVAPMGTSLTSEQVSLLAKFTKEIILMFDSDEAGQKATQRASELIKNAGLSVKVVAIPKEMGKDPDEFIKKNGKERFEGLLQGAVSDMDYRFYVAAKGLNLDSDDGKLKFISRAVQILASVNDDLARDFYTGKCSDMYGISRETLTNKTIKMRFK